MTGYAGPYIVVVKFDITLDADHCFVGPIDAGHLALSIESDPSALFGSSVDLGVGNVMYHNPHPPLVQLR